MTDQVVYTSLLAGWTPAQLLQAGANQVQIDAANMRILAAAQAAANAGGNQNNNPQGNAVNAGVQTLNNSVQSAVVAFINGAKISVFDKYFYLFITAIVIIVALLIGILLYSIWPAKVQEGATKKAPAAAVSATGLTASDLDAAIKRGADAALLACYERGQCVKK